MDRKESNPESCHAPSTKTFICIRLHSSLLEGDVQQILIPKSSLVDSELGKEGRLFRGSERYGCEENVMVRSEYVGHNHVYSKINHAADSTAGHVHVGTTSTPQRLVITPSEALKDLGRKARARLEEEKSRRPEIVVLNGPIEEKPIEAKPASAAKLPKRSPPAPRLTKKRRLKLASQSSLETKHRRVDEWMPDVTKMPVLPKELRSSTVQLFGLPKGCKVEQIKRFFKGLELETVSILLSNHVHIPQLDASARNAIEENAAVPRFDDDFRVFATFPSSPVASLAMERSGEILNLLDHQQDHLSSEKYSGVAISVTQASKPHAKLVRMLVSS